MTYSVFNQIAFLSLIGAGGTVTIMLVTQAVRSYRAAQERKMPVFITALIAFAIWLALSLYILLITAVYSIAVTHAPGGGGRLVKIESSLLSLIAHHLVWLLIGGGLVYWINRQARPDKRSSTSHFSSLESR